MHRHRTGMPRQRHSKALQPLRAGEPTPSEACSRRGLHCQVSRFMGCPDSPGRQSHPQVDIPPLAVRGPWRLGGLFRRTWLGVISTGINARAVSQRSGGGGSTASKLAAVPRKKPTSFADQDKVAVSRLVAGPVVAGNQCCPVFRGTQTLPFTRFRRGRELYMTSSWRSAGQLKRPGVGT